MHPLFTLIFDPFAGPAGFNLISIMFYIGLGMFALVAILERSLRD